MRHGFPCTNLFNSTSSWDFSVFKCLRAHIHKYLGSLWLSPKTGSGVCHVDQPHGLCTDGKSLSSVQSLSPVRLFVTPWTAAGQASLSITNSQSLLRVMSIESVMPSNHLILCYPVLLLPSIYPSIKVFTNESVFRIRWSKYWGFSFSINPFNEYSGLISFRRDWFDLLAAQGALKSFLQCYSSKASILWYSAFFMVQFSHPYVITGKTIALSIWLLSGSSQIFTLSTYFSLVIMFGRFWKGAWRKQLILKVWTEGNWRLNKLTYIGNYSVKWFFHPV